MTINSRWLIGWGINANGRDLKFKCGNFYQMDQNCNVTNNYEWCFYPSEQQPKTSNWIQPCPGDDGAGMFLFDGTWKLFAVYYDIQPRSSPKWCLSPQKGVIRGIQITKEFSEWINGYIATIHGNLCSVKVEMSPL